MARLLLPPSFPQLFFLLLLALCPITLAQTSVFSTLLVSQTASSEPPLVAMTTSLEPSSTSMLMLMPETSLALTTTSTVAPTSSLSLFPSPLPSSSSLSLPLSSSPAPSPSFFLPLSTSTTQPESSSTPPPSPPSSLPSQTTSAMPTETPTTSASPSDTTQPPTPVLDGGISIGAIIGIAVGAAIILVVLVVVGLVICCCCFQSKRSGEYVTGSEQRPWMVVRTWDPRSDHTIGRADSINSRASRGSSIASSIRESIRRLSGRRRSKGKGGELVESQVAMKSSPTSTSPPGTGPPPTTPTSQTLSMTAIIAIAAGGGGAALLIIGLLLLICCCWWCRARNKVTYETGNYTNPTGIVVRRYDQQYAPGFTRDGSLLGSKRSRGGSIRSSISSIASRLSLRRGGGVKKDEKLLQDPMMVSTV